MQHLSACVLLLLTTSSAASLLAHDFDRTHDILSSAFTEMSNHLEQSGLSVDPAFLHESAHNAAKDVLHVLETHRQTPAAGAPDRNGTAVSMLAMQQPGSYDLVHQVQTLVEKHLLLCAETALRKATARCDAAVAHLQKILATSQRKVATDAHEILTMSALATMEANLRKAIQRCHDALTKIHRDTQQHEREAAAQQNAIKAEIESRRNQLLQIKATLSAAFQGGTFSSSGSPGDSGCCSQDKLTDCLLPAMDAAPNPLMQCVTTHMCVGGGSSLVQTSAAAANGSSTIQMANENQAAFPQLSNDEDFVFGLPANNPSTDGHYYPSLMQMKTKSVLAHRQTATREDETI